MSEQFFASSPAQGKPKKPDNLESLPNLPFDPYLCPYLYCEHHKIEKGFSHRSSLEDHLRRIHGSLYRGSRDRDIEPDVLADGVDHSVDDSPCNPTIKSADTENVKLSISNEDVTVPKEYLKEMETMIRELQRRVDLCERNPTPLVTSESSSRRGSVGSLIDHNKGYDSNGPNRHHPRRQFDDEIVVVDDNYEPEVAPYFDPRLNPPPPRPSVGSPFTTQGLNPPEIIPVGVATSGSGPRLEIMRWRQCAMKHGKPEWYIDNQSAVGPSVSKDLSPRYLLTVIREFDRDGHFWRRRIEIVSPNIIEYLKDLALYDADLDSQDGPEGTELHLIEPLMVLFHSRKQLHDKGQEAPEEVKHQIQLIFDFMYNEFIDVSQKLNDIESAYPSGVVSYPECWLLYPPGTIVYSRENGEYEAFVVHSIRGMQKRQKRHNGHHSHTRLDLTCWAINYDGEVFGRVWSVHQLSPWHGTKAISSLELVPEKFLPHGATVKSELITRGKKFWSLQGQKFQEYTGEMYSQHGGDEAVRVMVDRLTYQRRSKWPISIDKKHGPTDARSKNWRDNRFARGESGGRRVRRYRSSSSSSGRIIRCRSYNPERHDDAEDRYKEPYSRHDIDPPTEKDDYTKYDVLEPDSVLDDFTLLLCPQYVHGYCLREKVWRKLNVTQIQPVAFRKNAWERLVLDNDYKDILQAMVSSYVGKTAKLDDLVAGKGAGLVALLHGSPGSGKTLTAECVAESFEKPLYQVTCGDVGTDPECLEERLEEIFDYAVTWGAVLLLDEADIFLQDRDYANLERNALVSIFLRTLEYFNGVLFLTTNRVGTFDQAFQSRIHVTLGLPSFDQHRRSSVWAIFLQDLAARGVITDSRFKALTKAVNERWSKEKLNGRQIRNAVRTALVVADKKGEMVGEKDFETVLKIAREFEGYMGMLGKGEVNSGLEGFQEV